MSPHKEKKVTPPSQAEKKKEKIDNSPYCRICGSCGYIDCDGVRDFLYRHVSGHTKCIHEKQIIEEIIELYDEAHEK